MRNMDVINQSVLHLAYCRVLSFRLYFFFILHRHDCSSSTYKNQYIVKCVISVLSLSDH